MQGRAVLPPHLLHCPPPPPPPPPPLHHPPPAGGEISFLQDVEQTLERVYARPVQLDPAFLQRKDPMPPRAFLARMLNNLKQVRARPAWRALPMQQPGPACLSWPSSTCPSPATA